MKDSKFTPAEPKTFTYFQNHGDEDGNNCYTLVYGEIGDLDHTIVATTDTEEDAKESCFRLNSIIQSVYRNPELFEALKQAKEALELANDRLPSPIVTIDSGNKIQSAIDTINKLGL